MSNRLQELREAQGLTLRELAARVGTSNQQISHLELGKRQLTTDWLMRLAAVLGCHPWEIVTNVHPSGLSDGEQHMLDNFRRMSVEQQNSLLADTTPRPGPSSVRKRRAS